MATTDMTRTGLNNQKREADWSVSDVVSTTATLDVTLFNLPANTILLSAHVLVTEASGTSTDTVDVKVGSTVVANEVVVGTTGTKVGSVTPAYFATGGAVSVVAGADAPDTAGRFRLLIQYVELDKRTGEYTN